MLVMSTVSPESADQQWLDGRSVLIDRMHQRQHLSPVPQNSPGYSCVAAVVSLADTLTVPYSLWQKAAGLKSSFKSSCLDHFCECRQLCMACKLRITHNTETNKTRTLFALFQILVNQCMCVCIHDITMELRRSLRLFSCRWVSSSCSNSQCCRVSHAEKHRQYSVNYSGVTAHIRSEDRFTDTSVTLQRCRCKHEVPWRGTERVFFFLYTSYHSFLKDQCLSFGLSYYFYNG